MVLVLVSLGLTLALVRSPLGTRLVYGRLYDLAGQITEDIGVRLGRMDPQVLQSQIERLAARYRVRILIAENDRGVIADSQGAAADLSAYPPDAMGFLEVREGEFTDPDGEIWRFIRVPVSEERHVLLAAQKPVLRALVFLGGEVFKPAARIGIISLLLSVLLALVVSASVIRPVNQMIGAMNRIAAGGSEERLSLQGPQEMRNAARAFNEMAARVSAAQQAERNFVANVSHELKTPLTSIQGFSQAILDGTAANEETRRQAAVVINREAQRLHRLVLDLLDLARIDSGQIRFQREAFQPVILLRNILEKFTLTAAEKGIELKSGFSPLPVIVGDADRLAQVFTNLMENAIKHTPEHGVVRIDAREDTGRIVVQVTDEGPGIPEDDLPMIFDRFYQVDKSRVREHGKGFGLGLAISREIIDAHNGFIHVESIIGRGSCFTVSLPVIQPDDETLLRRRTILG